jgi:hypothetical protein
MFYGESSIGNAANIFLVEIEYANYICGAAILNTSSESDATGQCIDEDWTLYGKNTNKHFLINKNGNTFTPRLDIA